MMDLSKEEYDGRCLRVVPMPDGTMHRCALEMNPVVHSAGEATFVTPHDGIHEFVYWRRLTEKEMRRYFPVAEEVFSATLSDPE